MRIKSIVKLKYSLSTLLHVFGFQKYFIFLFFSCLKIVVKRTFFYFNKEQFIKTIYNNFRIVMIPNFNVGII